MSKGRPIVMTRIDPKTLAEMDEQIDSLMDHLKSTQTKSWHRAEFIRAAISEKLAKMARSRGYKKKRTEPVSDGSVPE